MLSCLFLQIFLPLALAGANMEETEINVRAHTPSHVQASLWEHAELAGLSGSMLNNASTMDMKLFAPERKYCLFDAGRSSSLPAHPVLPILSLSFPPPLSLLSRSFLTVFFTPNRKNF